MPLSSARKASIMGVALPNKLSPVDLTTYKDESPYEDFYRTNLPDDPDEPWLYRFEIGDAVWIRTAGGAWREGQVSGPPKVGPTRESQGLYYPVTFGTKPRLRKYFASLNGELKPHTPQITELIIPLLESEDSDEL
ncbi:hypothetical protein BJ138DRAFT_500117 [Hygrophoropsis aurantiaca]|uniref:Uncharacterized protein n=1 Tax=Hygrophoropsis aurantiaca TaxID=72124 RepID=A0ACB8A414_9AGAM|nr:hypothetical protein BJ138DRAFT_500117 [Hygrophoropsis aurantiaca]